MATILIISLSNLANDPRVFRQIDNLRVEHTVIEMGQGPSYCEGVRYVHIDYRKTSMIEKGVKALKLKTGRYEDFYWSDIDFAPISSVLEKESFDLIICNDIETLPLATRWRGGAKILFDAHEYAPCQIDDQFQFRFFKKQYLDYLCRQYISMADRMITVSDGIADLYKNTYGASPITITNAREYCNCSPSPVSEPIRMIYHGGANPSRRIETMIRLMNYLDERFQLDLMLVPDRSQYFDKISKMAEAQERVRIIPPVPMTQIVPFSNAYDIGLYILDPVNLNQRYALPNKLFEYIQSRLAIAIGPSTEMKRVVERYRCGVVADSFDPESMGRTLNDLEEREIEEFKVNSHKAAQEVSAERNVQMLKEIITSLL